MTPLTSKTPFIKTALLFLTSAIPWSFSLGAEIKVSSEVSDRTVSPYLTGMNVVYGHESMSTWEDGKKTAALIDAGISCLRYPGGHVVSYWDWEFPYHNMYKNFWDPDYLESLTPAKKAKLKRRNGERMGLDDFLKICKEATILPVVGINMFQGYKFNRLDDSLEKAKRLVEYCQSQKPRVEYYFLDNEAGHQPARGNHIPIEEYIRLLPIYARAIKSVQPDAKLIVNPIRWGRVGDMITQAGEHFDIVDNHWYYTNRKWPLLYIDDWRAEEGNRKFKRKMSQFKKWKQESGHDHLKLGLLEWNIGRATGAKDSDKGTYLTQGLIQADMLMQFIKHDAFMAAAWPLMWLLNNNNPDYSRNFFDSKTGEPSPSRHIFRWFSMAGNGKILKNTISSSEGILAMSILHEDGKTILLYALNKSAEEKNVSLELPESFSLISAQSFEEGANAGEAVVKDLEVHSGDKKAEFKMTDTSLVFLKLKTD